MAIRKIELMHKTFGKCEGHTCGECSHIGILEAGNRFVRKCEVYGVTSSEASDWANKYQACGMYNKEWHGNDIIKLVNPERHKTQIEELEGQESFFEVAKKGNEHEKA